MSLTFAQKQRVVDEVAKALAASEAGVVAEYRGLSVAELTDLRKRAREAGVWVRVVKNNLAKRVLQDGDFACLGEHFVGPVVLSAAPDAVAVAKVMCDFAADNELLKIKAGAMHGAAIDLAVIQRLAKLPSRDQLLTKLVGVMQAPTQKFASTLNQVPTALVRVLGAVAAAKGAA